MTPAIPILVLGAYGTFGQHVARLLAARGFALTLAGRDRAKALALAERMGAPHRGLGLDAFNAQACVEAFAGHGVVVHCAGPYGPAHVSVLKACLAARCHYVDLAEERVFNALVRQLGPHFEAQGLTAVHGASSLPGISGALAAEALGDLPVKRARVTLWIGNRNVKGAGAIAAALAVAGRDIATPGGHLHGFAEPELVDLPAPIGRVTARSYDAPEYDLFPDLLRCNEVAVKVAFELGFASLLVSWVARLPGGTGARMARFLSFTGSLMSVFGTSGGAIQAELTAPDGTRRRATAVADTDGQALAALPAVLAAEHLATREGRPGACTAYELLTPRGLLDGLTAAGFRIVRD